MLSFNVISETKILTNISELTVYLTYIIPTSVMFRPEKRIQLQQSSDKTAN